MLISENSRVREEILAYTKWNVTFKHGLPLIS